MNLRMMCASRLPDSWMLLPLGKVARDSVRILDELLGAHVPEFHIGCTFPVAKLFGPLDVRRMQMASFHRQRVDLLVQSLGQEAAIELARGKLYPLGLAMGQRIRRLLGAKWDAMDLEACARIAYRVLGIHFELRWKDPYHARMRVDRCALSPFYDRNTCRALSAADEGMFAGLNPQVRMRFTEHRPTHDKGCQAEITLFGQEDMKP